MIAFLMFSAREPTTGPCSAGHHLHTVAVALFTLPQGRAPHLTQSTDHTASYAMVLGMSSRLRRATKTMAPAMARPPTPKPTPLRSMPETKGRRVGRSTTPGDLGLEARSYEIVRSTSPCAQSIGAST